jgi:hypothetical protein
VGKRGLFFVPVAAILLLLALFAGATSGAMSKGFEYHEVDLSWVPDAQDIDPGPVVVDSFVSEGEPFGRHLVNTRTPRSQTGGAIRTGTWRINLDTNQGGEVTSSCGGTFRIERVVLDTTETEQRVKYGGVVKIKDCHNARKFRRLEPGKLGNLRGETTCTISRCRGSLDIEGHVGF